MRCERIARLAPLTVLGLVGLCGLAAGAAAPSPGGGEAAPPAARPLRWNHGPGTSGGGASTASGETLKQGGLEVSFRTDFTEFENVSRAEAEAEAIQSGEFDALERSLIESVSMAYGLTDDLQVGAQIGYYLGRNFIDAEEDGLGGAESATADPEGLTDLWLSAK